MDPIKFNDFVARFCELKVKGKPGQDPGPNTFESSIKLTAKPRDYNCPDCKKCVQGHHEELILQDRFYKKQIWQKKCLICNKKTSISCAIINTQGQ